MQVPLADILINEPEVRVLATAQRDKQCEWQSVCCEYRQTNIDAS